MSSKAALGKRYTCFQCACKFYDLNKPEPVCPKCGADQREDPSPDPRVAVMARYKSTARPAAPKNVPADVDLDDEEIEDLDDEMDDDDGDGGEEEIDEDVD